MIAGGHDSGIVNLAFSVADADDATDTVSSNSLALIHEAGLGEKGLRSEYGGEDAMSSDRRLGV